MGMAGFVWNWWTSAPVGTRVEDFKHTSMHCVRTAVLFMCDVRLAGVNVHEREATPFSQRRFSTPCRLCQVFRFLAIHGTRGTTVAVIPSTRSRFADSTDE